RSTEKSGGGPRADRPGACRRPHQTERAESRWAQAAPDPVPLARFLPRARRRSASTRRSRPSGWHPCWYATSNGSDRHQPCSRHSTAAPAPCPSPEHTPPATRPSGFASSTPVACVPPPGPPCLATLLTSNFQLLTFQFSLQAAVFGSLLALRLPK